MSEKDHSKNGINRQDYLDRAYDDHALPLTRLINTCYSVEQYVKKNCRSGLDVGCGWGWAIKYFRDLGVEMHGFDVTRNILKDSISFCGIENLLIADGEKIPYKKDTFDLVFSWHVIEHVPHPEIFLKEIKRVLRDDGLLILGVPNDHALDILPFRPLRYLLNEKTNKIQKIVKLMTYHDMDHKREYTKNENELIDAGFEVLQINSYIFAFPFLSQFLRTISSRINKRLFSTPKRILLGRFVPQQFREAIIAVCKNSKKNMCGICGIYGLEDKELVKKMCKTLVHRGPDDQGIYTDSDISLGHRRLSIRNVIKTAVKENE